MAYVRVCSTKWNLNFGCLTVAHVFHPKRKHGWIQKNHQQTWLLRLKPWLRTWVSSRQSLIQGHISSYIHNNAVEPFAIDFAVSWGLVRSSKHGSSQVLVVPGEWERGNRSGKEFPERFTHLQFGPWDRYYFNIFQWKTGNLCFFLRSW